MTQMNADHLKYKAHTGSGNLLLGAQNPRSLPLPVLTRAVNARINLRHLRNLRLTASTNPAPYGVIPGRAKLPAFR